jgi:hypothetical protein
MGSSVFRLEDWTSEGSNWFPCEECLWWGDPFTWIGHVGMSADAARKSACATKIRDNVKHVEEPAAIY